MSDYFALNLDYDCPFDKDNLSVKEDDYNKKNIEDINNNNYFNNNSEKINRILFNFPNNYSFLSNLSFYSPHKK